MLSTKFCNGTTTTCDGLSQWGSQELAQQGFDSISILRRYYGDDIELVTNVPVAGIQNSYPGYPLRPGQLGENVVRLQTMLNRVSRDYPAIPKIPAPVNGVFDEATEQSVRKFQEIFGLTPDGVVGNATWYKLVFLYMGVLRLSELVSQGQRFYAVEYSALEQLQEGDRNEGVRLVQYMLNVVAEFYSAVPPVGQLDGVYGSATVRSVSAVQQLAGLPETGTVDQPTWEALYRLYVGITDTVARYTNVIPAAFRPDVEGVAPTQYPGAPLSLGDADQRGGNG